MQYCKTKAKNGAVLFWKVDAQGKRKRVRKDAVPNSAKVQTCRASSKTVKKKKAKTKAVGKKKMVTKKTATKPKKGDTKMIPVRGEKRLHEWSKSAKGNWGWHIVKKKAKTVKKPASKKLASKKVKTTKVKKPTKKTTAKKTTLKPKKGDTKMILVRGEKRLHEWSKSVKGKWGWHIVKKPVSKKKTITSSLTSTRGSLKALKDSEAAKILNFAKKLILEGSVIDKCRVDYDLKKPIPKHLQNMLYIYVQGTSSKEMIREFIPTPSTKVEQLYLDRAAKILTYAEALENALKPNSSVLNTFLTKVDKSSINRLFIGDLNYLADTLKVGVIQCGDSDEWVGAQIRINHRPVYQVPDELVNTPGS